MTANAKRLEEVWQRYQAMTPHETAGVVPMLFGRMAHYAATSKASWVGFVVDMLSESVNQADRARNRSIVTAGGQQ